MELKSSDFIIYLKFTDLTYRVDSCAYRMAFIISAYSFYSSHGPWYFLFIYDPVEFFLPKRPMSHIIFDTVLLLMFSRISDINNVRRSENIFGRTRPNTEETLIRRRGILPGHTLSTSVCHLDPRLTPTSFAR